MIDNKSRGWIFLKMNQQKLPAKLDELRKYRLNWLTLNKWFSKESFPVLGIQNFLEIV